MLTKLMVYGLRECISCYYWYLLDINDVPIASVKRNDYRIHFWYMSKDEVINLLRNEDLIEKSGTL